MDRDTFLERLQKKQKNNFESSIHNVYCQKLKQVMELKTVTKQEVQEVQDFKVDKSKLLPNYTSELFKIFEPENEITTKEGSFSWNGDRMLAIVLDKHVYIYNIDTDSTGEILFENFCPRVCSFMESQGKLVVAGDDGFIYIHTFDENNTVHVKLNSNFSYISDFTTLLCIDNFIYAGTLSGDLLFYDPIKNESDWYDIDDSVSLMLKFNDNTIIAVTNESVIYIINTIKKTSNKMLAARFGTIINVTTSSDPKILCCATVEGYLYLLDINSGTRIKSIYTGSYIYDVKWNPLLKRLITSQDAKLNDGYVMYMCDFELNDFKKEVTTHTRPITVISTSPSGRHACFLDNNGSVLVYKNNLTETVRHKVSESKLFKEIR